jgi:hypothetical protein
MPGFWNLQTFEPFNNSTWLYQTLYTVLTSSGDAGLVLDEIGQIAQAGKVDMATIADMLNPSAPMSGRLLTIAVLPPNSNDERSIALFYYFTRHNLPPSHHRRRGHSSPAVSCKYRRGRAAGNLRDIFDDRRRTTERC